MIKKLLVRLVIVLAVLTAAFFSLGIIYPKLEIVTRVEINKPVAVVWKYFMDESKMKDWMPGYQKLELVSGKLHQVGSTYKIYFTEDDHAVVMDETITAYEPNKLFAFRLENEMISDEASVEFISENGKTTVIQTDRIIGATPFWRSMFVLMQSHMHKQTQSYYDNLKANLEKM